MLNVDDGPAWHLPKPGALGGYFPHTLGTHSTILAGRQKDDLSNLFFEFILINLSFQKLNHKPKGLKSPNFPGGRF